MSTQTENSVSLPQVEEKQTTVGNYFVSNYPPFAYWTDDQLDQIEAVLDRPAPADRDMGLYVHIPFCRKRCHFCYFKVYTDKNKDEIRVYLDAVLEELRMVLDKPYIKGRLPSFVYFGGGTPSYLSPKQLEYLFNGMKQLLPWDKVSEVAFECEPGTLTGPKLDVLKQLGVTRLSLGIENLDDRHRSLGVAGIRIALVDQCREVFHRRFLGIIEALSPGAGRVRSGHLLSGLRLRGLRCCWRDEAVEIRYVGANEQENQHGEDTVQNALPLPRYSLHSHGRKGLGFEQVDGLRGKEHRHEQRRDQAQRASLRQDDELVGRQKE